MKIIVGMGNPGRKYRDTPHNVGFDVVDRLASAMRCSLRRSLRFKARVAKAEWKGEKVLLVQPQTYMNCSGESVGPIMRYGKAAPRDLIVVADTVDMEPGELRVKPGGGSGGHRGMESLIDHLENTDFARVRIGVGRGKDESDIVDYVLKPFRREQRQMVAEAVERAVQAVTCILESGIEEAMNKYNGRQNIERL